MSETLELLEVQINNSDEFLKVRETLTRIGVANRKDKVLYQSCHILHKKGKYYIVHFKELFALDGRESTITMDDYVRRNTIAVLLEEWGMLKILSNGAENLAIERKNVAVIPFKEKHEWELKPKYTIGKKH